MQSDAFAIIYEKARQHRDRLRRNPRLKEFFGGESREASDYPPVLGFGLPRDDSPVPLVTIALNASNEEFPDFIPRLDKAGRQWEAQSSTYFQNPYTSWWNLAGWMLTAATGKRLTYTGSGPRAAHADFTAIVTDRGMDSTYSECLEQAGEDRRDLREDIRGWMMESLTSTFVKLVSSLVEQNGTKAALVFGFAPPSPGNQIRGSATLMDAFTAPAKDRGIYFIGDGGDDGGQERPTVAWGHLAGQAMPENLRNLPFFFVSRGPSWIQNKQERLNRDSLRVKLLIDAAAKLEPRLGSLLGPKPAPPAGFKIRRK